MKKFVYIDNFCIDLSKVDCVIFDDIDCLQLSILFDSGFHFNIDYKDSDELYRDYYLLVEELNAQNIVLDEEGETNGEL